LRGFFLRRKADNAGGLTPVNADNVAAHKKDRKYIAYLIGY